MLFLLIHPVFPTFEKKTFVIEKMWQIMKTKDSREQMMEWNKIEPVDMHVNVWCHFITYTFSYIFEYILSQVTTDSQKVTPRSISECCYLNILVLIAPNETDLRSAANQSELVSNCLDGIAQDNRTLEYGVTVRHANRSRVGSDHVCNRLVNT